jgi:hypothetical protein
LTGLLPPVRRSEQGTGTGPNKTTRGALVGAHTAGREDLANADAGTGKTGLRKAG